MSIVGQIERATQDRVVRLFRERLGYQYLGNWEYRDNDKILFFMAHEFHELGMHEDMLDSYKKLVEEYPKSSLLLESLYIIGDYYFNRDNLDEAEKYYRRILEYRESPLHDMARYKLGWVAINRARLCS